MDPTTLMTFLFRAAPEIRTVELLGSWDNFQQPYRMHHDSRRGRGFYSGCFSFENIVFDGDVDLQRTKPRSGGLKQGGTYWYYYRLNYDFEAYDDRQPHTTACPLLPGQEVNIVDVPTELLELPSRCHSAYGDIIGTLADHGANQTMDPASKFVMLSPPPISRVHVRCLSDDALNGRLEGQNLVLTECRDSPVLTTESMLERPASRRSDSRKDRHLRDEPRSYDCSSRPCSPMNESTSHTSLAGSFYLTTPDCHDQPLTAISDSDTTRLCPYPRLAPAQHLFSDYPTILPTLDEEVAPDDVPHQLAGRKIENPFSPFQDRHRQPSSRCSSPSLNADQPLSPCPRSPNEDSIPDRPRLYSLPNTDLQSPSSPPFSSPPFSSHSSFPSSPQDSDHPTPAYSPSDLAPLATDRTITPETIHSVSARLLDLPHLSLSLSPPPAPEPPQREQIPRSGAGVTARSRANLWTYSLPPDDTDSTLSLAKTLSSAQSRETTIRTTAATAARTNGMTAAAPRLELSSVLGGSKRLSLGLNNSAIWEACKAGDGFGWKGVAGIATATATDATMMKAEKPGERTEMRERGHYERGNNNDDDDHGDDNGRRRARAEEPSIAEAIWSELGYLGESIA